MLERLSMPAVVKRRRQTEKEEMEKKQVKSLQFPKRPFAGACGSRSEFAVRNPRVHYGNLDSGSQCQLILRWRATRKIGEKEYTAGRVKTMAAEIHSRPQTARPILLNKIEGHSDAVNAAVLIPKEDGVITVSEDR